MKVFSASQINTFLSCGYKYKLQYVDKVKVDVVSPYLERGIRVHEKLESDTYISDNAEDAVLLSNATALLLKLNDRHDVLSHHENELKLFGDIVGERFVGIIDRVWPSEHLLLDWKTGSLKRNWKEGGYYGERDYCVQVYIYSELYSQNRNNRIENIYVAFLGNGELWKPRIGTAHFRSDQFTMLCEKTISSAIDGIKSGEFERNKQTLCKWCDYKDICRASEDHQ